MHAAQANVPLSYFLFLNGRRVEYHCVSDHKFHVVLILGRLLGLRLYTDENLKNCYRYVAEQVLVTPILSDYPLNILQRRIIFDTSAYASPDRWNIHSSARDLVSKLTIILEHSSSFCLCQVVLDGSKEI